MNEFKDWDVKIDDQIDFFDPSLSYELTGYRPITETNGLDFDPSWFMEVVDYKNKKGVHCSSPPGSYAFRNFWLGEYDKCKNGYSVNGYRITGHHYFFLNFYKLLNANNVGKAGSGREYSNPNFWAKHYEYFHYLEMCELLEKDACALKSRGVGFSEIGASIGACTYSVVQNSKTMYVASAENYLLKNGVLQKVWDCLETLNQETEGGLRHLTQKKKEPMWRRASVLDKQGQESGWMSELFGQVVDNPRKLRGVRLEYLLFEECFGKSTKVVMSDFSIKNIEDIIIGDFVLGIDGKPKEVMRTCTGIDDLYLVKQKKGFDYIVNSKHKLYFESRPRVNNMPDEIKLITAKEYNDLSSYYKSILYGIKSNPIKDIPFTEIKGNQMPNDYLETSNKLSTGIDSIDYIGKGEYFGITLKSYGDEQTDNLFLLEDFTIVHNCGSFNGLVTVYNQSEALVNLLGKKIGTRILWGTGGDSGQGLAGLEEIFLNPKNFNILPYYHNHFENGEYRLTGFFIPAYSCLPPLMDSRGVTNQEKAKEHYNKIRAQKVSTPKNWLEYCSEFCFYPEEALSKQGENQFDQVKIAEQITEVKILKNTPKTLKVGKLTWNYKDNSEEIIGVTFRPDPGGNIIVLEEPLTDDIGKPFEGLYVGGIDSIDHAEGDSVVGSDGSKFAITIKKRTFGNEGNKYVCMYMERPKDVRTAYENAAKILWWYGCKANLEDTKIGFRMYLQERKLLYKMLMKRPVSAQSSIKRSSTLWGTPGSEKMIQHGLDLVAQYVDDFYFNIWFIDMLEQLQKFSYEAKGRFDIILSMVYTEIADEDMMGIVVKKDNPMQSDWEEYGEIGWFTDSRGYKYFGYEKQYDNYSSERNPRIHSNIF